MPMEGAVGTAQRVAFNPVDEVVHLLDTEAEPWSIQLEVRVAGTVDEDRLRTALSEALDRHPMARARKAPTARRDEEQYCWEITPKADLDPLRVVDCPDDEALQVARSELQSRSVPLTESPPLRMWLVRNPHGDVLMVNANHAAMDGFGVLRFVRSVARAYAQEPDPVPDVDPVEARNLETLVGTDDTPTRLRRVATVAEKARDTVAAPARIAPDGGVDRPGYDNRGLVLGSGQDAAWPVGRRGYRRRTPPYRLPVPPSVVQRRRRSTLRRLLRRRPGAIPASLIGPSRPRSCTGPKPARCSPPR